MPNLKNKTIVITGGTGSFGHELLRTIADRDFKEVRIFSRDELKQEHMRIELNNPRVKFYIGDVRDRGSVDQVMKGADLIFHAAALKQVPSCEFFPMQAVMTNIIGSHNVVESAVAHRAESVVCLGTDKAAYPINAMGMTKALMEKVAQAACRGLGRSDTRVCTVRYGNVMCSRGSVIPLFIKQIKERKPITITEPSMTRFLLPLPEAIKLVLFAFKHSGQGDLFIRKSPACTVGDLALALKELFKSGTELKTIGIRHGEKIYETLTTTEELRRSEDMGDYFRVRMDGRDLNYSKYLTEGDRKEALLADYTSHNTVRLNVKQIKDLLLTLPEITSEMVR